jgi:hypothetical protein
VRLGCGSALAAHKTAPDRYHGRRRRADHCFRSPRLRQLTPWARTWQGLRTQPQLPTCSKVLVCDQPFKRASTASRRARSPRRAVRTLSAGDQYPPKHRERFVHRCSERVARRQPARFGPFRFTPPPYLPKKASSDRRGMQRVRPVVLRCLPGGYHGPHPASALTDHHGSDLRRWVETTGLEPASPCLQSGGGGCNGVPARHLRRVEQHFRPCRPGAFTAEPGTKLGTRGCRTVPAVMLLPRAPCPARRSQAPPGPTGCHVRSASSSPLPDWSRPDFLSGCHAFGAGIVPASACR